MLWFTTLTDLTCFFCVFIFEIDNLPSFKFCFLTSCLLFHSRFSLILFIFLVSAYSNSFGVKAWYFHYAKMFFSSLVKTNIVDMRTNLNGNH